MTTPVFGITGWKMYLDRHRREHDAAAAAKKRSSREHKARDAALK